MVTLPWWIYFRTLTIVQCLIHWCEIDNTVNTSDVVAGFLEVDDNESFTSCKYLISQRLLILQVCC
jgi:hypothetical protein